MSLKGTKKVKKETKNLTAVNGAVQCQHELHTMNVTISTSSILVIATLTSYVVHIPF